MCVLSYGVITVYQRTGDRGSPKVSSPPIEKKIIITSTLCAYLGAVFEFRRRGRCDNKNGIFN